MPCPEAIEVKKKETIKRCQMDKENREKMSWCWHWCICGRATDSDKAHFLIIHSFQLAPYTGRKWIRLGSGLSEKSAVHQPSIRVLKICWPINWRETHSNPQFSYLNVHIFFVPFHPHQHTAGADDGISLQKWKWFRWDRWTKSILCFLSRIRRVLHSRINGTNKIVIFRKNVPRTLLTFQYFHLCEDEYENKRWTSTWHRRQPT